MISYMNFQEISPFSHPCDLDFIRSLWSMSFYCNQWNCCELDKMHATSHTFKWNIWLLSSSRRFFQNFAKMQKKSSCAPYKCFLWNFWTFLVKELEVFYWVHNFFFFFKGANIDWPISNSFGTLGTAPIEAPLWTTSCKI